MPNKDTPILSRLSLVGLLAAGCAFSELEEHDRAFEQLPDPDDYELNCTVLCARMWGCTDEASTMEHEEWLVNKHLEGCEQMCIQSVEHRSNRQENLAAAVACDQHSDCAGFYRCLHQLTPLEDEPTQ